MPHEPMRPINWRGEMTREARRVTESCAREWGVAGLTGQREPYYAPTLPDRERRGEP